MRHKHRLAEERVLERRLENSPVDPRAQAGWTPPKDEMTRVLARLRTVPWVGGYLSDTMRYATVSLMLAIPALLVAGTIVSGDWLNLPGALLCGLAAAALPVLRALQAHTAAETARRAIAVSDRSAQVGTRVGPYDAARAADGRPEPARAGFRRAASDRRAGPARDDSGARSDVWPGARRRVGLFGRRSARPDRRW
jgi:hypothetical protein